MSLHQAAGLLIGFCLQAVTVPVARTIDLKAIRNDCDTGRFQSAIAALKRNLVTER